MNRMSTGDRALPMSAEESEKVSEETEAWELEHPTSAAQSFETRVERHLTSNSILGPYRLLFNCATSPLHFIVHLLGNWDRSTPAGQNPTVQALAKFVDAPPKVLRDRLGIVSAPFLWNEHESRLEPERNPAPELLTWKPVAVSRSKPTQLIDNTSILFYNAHLVVEYRVCPPDTCSGQAAIVENYPRAEYLIGKLVDLHFTRLALSELDPKLSDHRSKVLIRFLRRLTSFVYESEEDKTRLIALLDEAFVDVAVDKETFFEPQTASIHDIFTLVGATFKHVQYQATGTATAPCLCDMTHLCDQLEQSVGKVSRMVDELLAKQPDLATFQLKQLQAKAETGIKNGSLKGSMWKGPWKLRSPGFFEFIGKPLNEVMLKEEHRVAYVMGWRHLFAVVGSARLFEEASFAASMQNSDPSINRIFSEVISKTMDGVFSTEKVYGACSVGDSLFSQNSAGALAFYQIHTLLDASFWPARLKAAKERIQIASTTPTKHFQYSRAVYDCTVALHYGGDNAEAYLHRGITLARLKLWEKAIIDLERVVALEPKNPIAKRELANAKQELK